MRRSTVRALCKSLLLRKVAARISTARCTTTFAQSGYRQVIDQTPLPGPNNLTPASSIRVVTSAARSTCLVSARAASLIGKLKTGSFSLWVWSSSVRLGIQAQNWERFPRQRNETGILASHSPPELEILSVQQRQLGTQTVPP